MPADLVSGSTTVLEQGWKEIVSLGDHGALTDWLDDSELVDAVRQAVNSRTKSYRYVLPTQLVAKVVDSTLDCRCLQVGRGGAGAFDARTVAHKVIVPFDQSNSNVLGGSPEPYVNNPLRRPEVSKDYAAPQKNSVDWDCLCNILSLVESRQDPRFTELVLKQTLTEVYRRLAQVRVSYPTPLRVSADSCMQLLIDYLAVGSGGDRLLALTAALFVVIGRRFKLYDTVRRASITSADLATGLLADLECVDENGVVALAVEVKDKTLTVSQMNTKISSIREKRVSEVFFVAQQGLETKETEQVSSIIQHEFVSGHNIYVLSLTELANVIFPYLVNRGVAIFSQKLGCNLSSTNPKLYIGMPGLTCPSLSPCH